MEVELKTDWTAGRQGQAERQADKGKGWEKQICTKRGRATKTKWHACQCQAGSLSHHFNTTTPQMTAKHMVPLCLHNGPLSVLCSGTYAQKSAFSKEIRSGSDFKTNNSTCVFLTVTALFGDKYLYGSYDFVSQTYTNTRVSVSVCEVVSRPWQRQEIPWDVFNKSRQRLPENWQMKTCWSTPQSCNNTLPALTAVPRSSTQMITLCV